MLVVVFQVLGGLPDLSRSVARYVAQLNAIVLGERHPFALIWARLTAAHASDAVRLAACQAFVDAFETLTGFSSTTLRSFNFFYYTMMQRAADVDALVRRTRMLRQSLAGGCMNPYGVVMNLHDIMWPLIESGQYHETELALEAVREYYFSAWSTVGTDFRHHREMIYWYDRRMADLKRRTSTWAEHREYQLMHYQRAVELYGSDHQRTSNAFQMLVKELEKAGEAEEAAKVRQQHDLQWEARVQREIRELGAGDGSVDVLGKRDASPDREQEDSD